MSHYCHSKNRIYCLPIIIYFIGLISVYIYKKSGGAWQRKSNLIMLSNTVGRKCSTFYRIVNRKGKRKIYYATLFHMLTEFNVEIGKFMKCFFSNVYNNYLNMHWIWPEWFIQNTILWIYKALHKYIKEIWIS